MRRSHGIRTFFGLGLAVLFAAGGCAFDGTYADEDIGTEEQDILNGSTGENTGMGAEVSVFITYNSTPQCSGVLVKRNWVLTSAHCVLSNSSVGANDPGLLDVHHKDVPLGATWVKKHPWYNAADKSHDIALIQVSRSALDVPSNEGWTTYLADWVPASAFNQQQLRCYGYGNVAEGWGAGTLRTADLKVVSTTQYTVDFVKNGAGQNLMSGDSGGGCFMKYPPMGEPSDLPYLVGVNRSTSSTGSRADYAPIYKPWIEETIRDKWVLDMRKAMNVNPCASGWWNCIGPATVPAGEDEENPVQ